MVAFVGGVGRSDTADYRHHLEDRPNRRPVGAVDYSSEHRLTDDGVLIAQARFHYE
ncbi:hypothetical protein [uncultured Plantibacter sp.]|uniref:hypothetical protein n=1 Tax=uncultured Plantibacter sp. TaxID=293337 RepID=UPI0028D3434A|nr:hypothetical protein [uncultured Plantibacter sp.]